MTASEGAVRSASDRHPAMIAYPRGAVRAFVGHPHLFPLPTAASGVHRARGRGRAHPLEPREAPGDLRHDGILGTLGAKTELARNSAGLPNQLGSRVSLGGDRKSTRLNSSHQIIS